MHNGHETDGKRSEAAIAERKVDGTGEKMGKIGSHQDMHSENAISCRSRRTCSGKTFARRTCAGHSIYCVPGRICRIERKNAYTPS